MLGFSPVYRYAAGKLDWVAFALLMEGEFAAILKAGDVIRPDIPTCTLHENVGEAHQRCQAAGWKVCLVVTKGNIVLGRLRGDAWKAEPDTPVEEVMENGPTTFRPDNFLEPLAKRMRDKKSGVSS